MRSTILSVLITLLMAGCSHPFKKLTRSSSGAIPKKYLIAPVVKPSEFIGRFARPAELSTPVITGNTIYVGSVHDQFIALKRRSGKVAWTKTIKGGIESSPQYFDDKVYFGANDGYFYCLHARTGKTIWRYKTNSEILSAPVIRGGLVYFMTSKNEIYALKAQDGKWVWYHNRGYLQKISIRGTASPIYHDGKIYIGFSDGSFFAFNAFNGAVVWQRSLTRDDKFVDVDVTAVIGRGAVFTGTSDGHIFALDDKSGETVWQKKYAGVRNMAADDERLFVSSLRSKVYALDRTNGRKVWEFNLEAGVPTDPIVVEDQLIFGTSDKYAHSLLVNDGSEIWRYNTDTGVSAKPVYDSDRVYLYSHFSTLHVLDPFYLLGE